MLPNNFEGFSSRCAGHRSRGSSRVHLAVAPECTSQFVVQSGSHRDLNESGRITERSDADLASVLARHRIGVQCRIGASLDSAYFECPNNLLARGGSFRGLDPILRPAFRQTMCQSQTAKCVAEDRAVVSRVSLQRYNPGATDRVSCAARVVFRQRRQPSVGSPFFPARRGLLHEHCDW